MSEADFCRSILETGLGMMALSAATFRPLYPSSFVEKPKQDPIALMWPNMDEKRSLESHLSHSRDSSSVAGAQMSARTTVQRKVSEKNTKDR